jgi:hypothetical protein
MWADEAGARRGCTRRRARQALDWSRMRIYIDEAGPFVVPSSAQSLFSLVLAVVVPSSAEDALFAELSVLRDGWWLPRILER